jgi:predicted ATPase/DNA-binding CsgD family transcriptional regulator
MQENPKNTTPSPAPVPPGKLPASVTPFIGRQRDLDVVIKLFQDPSIRLITILGSGGMGKTRISIELAGVLKTQFQDGAIFVPMAQLSKIDEFLPALAGHLGVQNPPGGDLKLVIMDHLGKRQILLLLDNFEHLLGAAMLVRDLLVCGPQVKVLVTSRQKLSLEGETLYHLEGLDLPPLDDRHDAQDFDAIRLFLQKARQVRPGFSLNEENSPAVIRICHLVGGNPLGILLAAAWLEHFSPAEIVEQVKTNLDFLSQNAHDAEPRHSNMRAVIKPSLDRLNEQQKAVFRRLAWFRGGFTLAAATSVAGADLHSLIALVERSLLSRDPESGRYFLHELLRQYACEELQAAGETGSIQAAHTAYFLAFVQEREPVLISNSQTRALDEIQVDFDNIRQAFYTGVENRDFNAIRTMLSGIYKFCDMRSRAYEGEALFCLARNGLAPRTGEDPQPAWALALLCWYDMRTYGQPFDVIEEIPAWAQSCLKYAETIHDLEAMAVSLVLSGAWTEDANEFKTAIRLYKKAMQIYPQLDDVYWVNIRIGLCHVSARQFPQGIRAFQESLRRGKETGERLKQAWALLNTGDTLLLQENPLEARDNLEKAYTLFQEIGNKFGLVWSNFSLSRVAIELGDASRAREHAEIAGNLAEQLHTVTWSKKVAALLQELKPEHLQPLNPAPLEDGEKLSQRELEILQLLKSDLNGPEIADQLIISLNTVRFHTKNIYQKLGVNNRLEAIRRAKELGL